MAKMFLCAVAALLVSVAAVWRDPEVARSLAVAGNFSGALAAGAPAELVCRAHGIPDNTIITWLRGEGAFSYDEFTRGYVNVSLALSGAPALNGAEYYCFAPFSEPIESTGRLASYFVYSDRFKVEVQGAPAPSFASNEGRIEMTSEAASDTHSVGDIVRYFCTTYFLDFPFITVIQAKGLYEMQLNVGMQSSRTLALNLTQADHGTNIYCTASVFDPMTFTTYTLISNRVPIHVQ